MHMTMTKGTTRFFARKTHAVDADVRNFASVGFLGKDLDVASRENLGRDHRLWRRTDDERYPCV